MQFVLKIVLIMTYALNAVQQIVHNVVNALTDTT